MRISSKLIILAAAVSATFTTLPAHAGATLDRIMSTKTMTLASDAAYPPQSFLNDNNEMDGFDVEVARQIASRMGAKLKVVTPAWEIITSGGWGSRWDISVGSMSPTTKRSEVLTFPAVYYYTPAAFAVHKKSKVTSIDELNGKKIGLCGGCTTESYMNKDLIIEGSSDTVEYSVEGVVRSYETDTNAFDDLRIGDGKRLDAVLSPLPTIQEAIKNNYPMKLVGEPVFFEPLAVAIDKGDAEFAAKVKSIVADMHSDGTLTELSMKWYGIDYTKSN